MVVCGLNSLEITRHRCVSMDIKTVLFIKAHFWNAPKSHICHVNQNPLSFVLGILCVENVPRALLGVLPCGRLLSETVRGPAQLSFSGELSLPFLTITRLFILLCLYLQPNLIPSASLCFLLMLLCYYLFNFWKWKKFERKKVLFFFPLDFYDSSDFFLTAWGMNVRYVRDGHAFFV